jgi:hypothetical protein
MGVLLMPQVTGKARANFCWESRGAAAQPDDRELLLAALCFLTHRRDITHA